MFYTCHPEHSRQIIYIIFVQGFTNTVYLMQDKLFLRWSIRIKLFSMIPMEATHSRMYSTLYVILGVRVL